MTNENTVSDCCNATMTVEGETTHYYACSKCGKACNPANQNTHRLLTDEEAKAIAERSERAEYHDAYDCKHILEWDIPALLADRAARIEREKKVRELLEQVKEHENLKYEQCPMCSEMISEAISLLS